jgi:hypothetical protein
VECLENLKDVGFQVGAVGSALCRGLGRREGIARGLGGLKGLGGGLPAWDGGPDTLCLHQSLPDQPPPSPSPRPARPPRARPQVGTGVMVGLPGQTLCDLAGDIAFFKKIGANMIGMVGGRGGVQRQEAERAKSHPCTMQA